ncbi:MAG: cobalamin-dependent protein, partial [Candidatus Omnitrophica bacterium]|nr:cobalamin-dependent protein [Candidatus Omnitrophota bacterium]
MRILLINPPSGNIAVTTREWMTTAEDIGAFPPIGLMYVASYLRSHLPKHEIRILDTVLLRMSYADIEKEIRSYSPDIVGITTYTPIFYDVMSVVKIAKKVNPQIHVCLGGAHTSVFPGETIEKPEVDSLVLGEGDIIFTEFVDALDKGRDLKTVKGLAIKRNGGCYVTGKAGYISDINSLPPPAFDLLPFEKYHSAIGTGNTVGTICSSRGCPYDCTFCDRPYRSYRARTPENILDEIEKYYNFGIREFFFFDDMFNITPERVQAVAREIIRRDLKIVWSFRGRVDQINDETLKIAKTSGCHQILFGV